MAKQKIICTEKNCIHIRGGYTAHDYSYEYVCYNPDGVVISTKKGCQSKEEPTLSALGNIEIKHTK